MVMQAQLEDGRLLEFPDGTDPSVIQATVKKVLGVSPDPVARMPGTQLARESGLFKGMTDPVMGMAQMVEQMPGTVVPPEAVLAGIETKPISKRISVEEAIYQREREKQGDEGFDWTRMLGNFISPASAPLMVVPGSQATLPARMTTGAAMGAIGSGQQPVTSEGDFWEKKAIQAGTGATVGAVIPAATSTVSNLWKMTRPLSHKGIEKDIAEYLEKIAGGDKDKIIAALRNAKKGETAQQALGRAVREAKARGDADIFGIKIARIEDELEASKLTSDAISKVKAKQAYGREKTISEIAKTPEELKDAEALRAAAGERNYKKAFETVTEADEVLGDIAQNPYFKDMISEADKLAKAKASRGEQTALTEYLHNIKLGLDKKLQVKAGAEGALDKAGKAEVKALKKELVDWMGKNNPLYETARAEHMRLSRPIEKMQVGRELQKSLTGPKETERATTFLNTMREAPRTIKRATGEPRYTSLEQVIPEDMPSVQKVADELLDIQYGKELAGKKSGLLSDLDTNIEPQLPHILSRPVVIANTMLRLIGKDKTPEYQAVLEDLVLNPKKLADYLSRPAKDKQRQMAEDIVKRMSTLSTSQTLGRAVGDQ